MAKRKRKSAPASTTAMDLDTPSKSKSTPPPPKPTKSLLSAHTDAGITKRTRLPRGKGRRAQRMRKEKGAERAEEVQARTERKVERSLGRGRRKGERNAKWEELNKRIKGVAGEGKRVVSGKDGQEEWVDEEGGEREMLDIEENEEVGTVGDGRVGGQDIGTVGEKVDGGIE
ncbi:MAG: hypothetical protein Q9182_002992 [Xanthomendoza sp. 2 TL-2023]